jgi:hypothetical protein
VDLSCLADAYIKSHQLDKHRQVLKIEYRKVLEAIFIGFGSAFRFFVGGENP